MTEKIVFFRATLQSQEERDALREKVIFLEQRRGARERAHVDAAMEAMDILASYGVPRSPKVFHRLMRAQRNGLEVTPQFAHGLGDGTLARGLLRVFGVVSERLNETLAPIKEALSRPELARALAAAARETRPQER